MAKKISAILLALVICLGIFVLPTTAIDAGYTLPEGKKVAYEFKLDKENYLPGDTVTVSVYVYAQDGMEMGATNIFVGMDKNLFDQADNAVATIKSTSTTSAALESYFKTISASTPMWLADTIVSKITEGNTEAENAMFNQYLKIALTRNTKATGTNASNSKRGLPASEFNGKELFTIQLKLKDDIAAGTAINIGTPSGAMTTAYANVGYFVEPFSAAVAKTTAAESDTIFAAANVWSAGCAAGNHTAAEEAVKVYTAEATCEADGKYNEVVMCQFCDEVFSTSEEKTEAALGHDMVETAAEVAATCEVAGKTAVKECSRCDATEGGDEIAAPGHKYIETVRRAATCYAVGDLRITCENCSYNEKKEIPKTEHVLEEVPGVEPTCTTAGREAGTKCTNNCFGIGETGAEIPAKGHTETNVVVVAPTYQDKGYTEFYCPDCDKTLRKDYTDKLNADFTLTIKEPEVTTVANGNTVVLEAEVAGGEYIGLSIVWTVVEGEGIFETVQTEDGKFEITASGYGEATFVAELVDAEGNKYGSDSVKMTAEPDMLTQIKLYITSLWDKLLALIMGLIMG